MTAARLPDPTSDQPLARHVPVDEPPSTCDPGQWPLPPIAPPPGRGGGTPEPGSQPRAGVPVAAVAVTVPAAAATGQPSAPAGEPSAAEVAGQYPPLGELGEQWQWWWADDRVGGTLCGRRVPDGGGLDVLYIDSAERAALTRQTAEQELREHVGGDLATVLHQLRGWPA